MAARSNCWEYRHCGREPGGAQVNTLGLCPAAIESRLDGINGGTNGGRACWAVEDTVCFETIGAKFLECLHCDFLLQVQDEEGATFQLMGGMRERLRTGGPTPSPPLGAKGH
ncbi:MAG: hypothetical protein COW73_10215 [Nitrospirae bacterium CG18_big_fil_WC_8_21_14_2_50_70_55]|nr:hypothetical protein [Deltaproteobacteria bacterium]OIP63173.1 MAG: hypothetical protein AUK30_08910 [Nitrospirae bacterium CG2_30_70_394]PIQ03696.1 MAG: hypothetical protein COW73_10215 [Nitrospirae bacterium CG18_big_fil_WC_8_21_14_2_50_70_55]PIU77513.1 MAG: hypothetical protein COS73_10055 [Nitrospirae bacterium CG06_land_8_20_14_3_00_70_43]PIW82757.1 MAG: hypothetical protein COZ96_07065 [Nitrospirae bacterium CG_4_8_14_3_um_filter_70_85]PIX84144.1 MAG: hypothetical protein COZ33_01745 